MFIFAQQLSKVDLLRVAGRAKRGGGPALRCSGPINQSYGGNWSVLHFLPHKESTLFLKETN